MDKLFVLAWAWASLVLLLIVTNVLTPGQIYHKVEEPWWVVLLLLPTIVWCAVRGTIVDRATAALLLFLPLPWLISPIDARTDRHRTEYYDTYSVMAASAFQMLLRHVSEREQVRASLLNDAY